MTTRSVALALGAGNDWRCSFYTPSCGDGRGPIIRGGISSLEGPGWYVNRRIVRPCPRVSPSVSGPVSKALSGIEMTSGSSWHTYYAGCIGRNETLRVEKYEKVPLMSRIHSQLTRVRIQLSESSYGIKGLHEGSRRRWTSCHQNITTLRLPTLYTQYEEEYFSKSL